MRLAATRLFDGPNASPHVTVPDPHIFQATKPGRARRAGLAAVALGALLLAGCNGQDNRANRHHIPLTPALLTSMEGKGMTKASPILIRSFKKESELEVWKKDSSGRYALLKTYPMCRWSGQLGPKTREGDRQAPEGFYPISAGQMNPNSAFFLSFDMGYPNQFDRAHGRTGSALMVHGACSSRGCYSMTDEQIAEIYALVREAHSGGQARVMMQAYPFRMTAQNLAKHRADPNIAFWRNLKEGNDHFEVTRDDVQVASCGRRYVFNASPRSGGLSPTETCPPLERDETVATAVAAKQREDEAKIAALVAGGAPAVKLVYTDGDQHPSFRGTALAYSGGAQEERATLTAFASPSSRPSFADVSRPEALASGPQEIPLDDRTGKPKTLVAAATPAPAAPVPATPAPATPAKPAPSGLSTRAPAAVTPAPAAPSPIVTARASVAPRTGEALAAAQPAPVAAPASAPGERSMFQRALSLVGGSRPAEPAPAVAAAPAAPAPAARATEPRRATVPAPAATSERAPAATPAARKLAAKPAERDKLAGDATGSTGRQLAGASAILPTGLQPVAR